MLFNLNRITAKLKISLSARSCCASITTSKRLCFIIQDMEYSFLRLINSQGKKLLVNADASDLFSVKKLYISGCSEQVLNGVADPLGWLCPRLAYVLNGG